MEKKVVSIFDCKPGMKVATTLYNKFGAEMVVEGTVLDRQTLDRIESMEILEIEVYAEEKETVRKNYIENVYNKYDQNVQDIKNIANDIGKGNPLDMEKVKKIIETISSGIYSGHDITSVTSRSKDTKDYVYTHSINVSAMARALGKWMRCSQETIEHLTLAGLLHDIGKFDIPDEIINKPGQLTDKEFDIIKQHPRLTYKILEDIDEIHKNVSLGILTHHEREDGTGYPIGITSEKINLVGKILAVADIYDAMTSERIYRKSQTPFEVFELMQNGSFGKLHPVILNKFIKNMAEYYNGSIVALNNGEQGEVVFINYNKISRPIVKVDERFIDLSLEPTIKIERILKNNNKV